MAHLTIDITPELARQLQEEAARRGLGVSEYVRPALEALVTAQTAQPSAAALLFSRPPSAGRHLAACAGGLLVGARRVGDQGAQHRGGAQSWWTRPSGGKAV